jgi:predicted ABC-type ATPase
MPQAIISKALLDYYLVAGDYNQRELALIRADADYVYGRLTAGKTPHPDGSTSLTMAVGPPGAGKTHLTHFLATKPEHKDHTILIDPDTVREIMPIFIKGSEELTFLSRKDADREMRQKWNAASIYVAQHALRKAHEEGYNIIRCGASIGIIAEEICERSQAAGLRLNMIAVMAPFDICKTSIAQRFNDGGHPVRDDFFVRSYTNLAIALPSLIAAAEKTDLYWRPKHNACPIHAATLNNQGGIAVHNGKSYQQMMRAMQIAPDTLLGSSRDLQSYNFT